MRRLDEFAVFVRAWQGHRWGFTRVGLIAAVLGPGAAVGGGCALPVQVSGSSAAESCSLATCSKTVRLLTMVLGSSRVSRETARSPHACRCHDMKWKAWFPRVNSQCTRVLRALLVPWLRQWRRPASSTKASFEGIVSPPFLSFVEVEWKHSAGTPYRRAAIPDLGDRSHSL